MSTRNASFPFTIPGLTQWAESDQTHRLPPLRWLHQAVRVLLITSREMEQNRLNLRAGSLTYALLLSMVPMLAMSTAVVKGLGGGNQLREVAYSYIATLEQSAPKASLPETGEAPEEQSGTAAVDLATHLRSAVDQVFDYVDRTNFATLGTVGMVGIFLSVILVLGQIETAMNTIWHVEDGRSILRKVADYLTLMVLFPIAINVALAAGALLKSQALAVHVDRFLPMDWLQTLLLRGVPIAVLTATLYILYIFFPNTRLKTVPTLIGAFVGALLWFLTQNVYISLQIGVAKQNAIYGSFATIPLFLVWIYFGWLFVLLGAQLAYSIQKRTSYRLVEKPIVPALELSAALDLSAEITNRFREQRTTRFDDLAEALPSYDPEQLTRITNGLIAAGLFHRAQETGEIMPSLPPEDIAKRQVIETILGLTTPETPGGSDSARAITAALASHPETGSHNSADAEHTTEFLKGRQHSTPRPPPEQ